MTWLVLIAVIVGWLWLTNKVRNTRWLPFVATMPLWGPFAVYIIYMLATEGG